MATIIDEQKMIEGNVFLYEQRLQSPIRRFVDKSFTPTTYFHIKTSATTIDSGYQDVAEILGRQSPIKFQKIENFPLYGIEQILPQLQDGDSGLDSSYEGEAIVMADTIEPLPNDYFMINMLNEAYIFRVISVEYDTVTSERCFKIGYTLEYIDNEKVEELHQQTQDEFTCILENIGTDDKCIIEKESDALLKKIDAMYDEIANTYMTFFYNERYNCFLGDFVAGEKLYDPLQTVFVNKHSLFSRRGQLDSLILTEQFDDNRRKVKYEKSIYRFFEQRRLEKISNFDFVVFAGTNNTETGFYRWLDKSVKILDVPKIIDPINHYQVMPDEVVDLIRLNGPTDSKVITMLQKYIRDPEMSIHDIDLTLHDEIMFLDDANLEVFFYTPVIMYIIKSLIKEHLSKEREIK